MKCKIFTVGALVTVAAAALYSQSITATKAYVDRKYTDATNAVTNETTVGWRWELHPDFVSATDPVFHVINGPDGKPDVAYWDANFTMSDGYVMEGSLSVNPGDGNSLTLEFDQGTAHRVTRNALGLARLKDLEPLPTYEAVTNTARDVVNTVWDAKLGVAWEARMHDGHLYYIAVTNAPGGAE